MTPEEITALQARAAKADELQKEIDGLKSKPKDETPPKVEDKDLNQRVADDKKEKEERAAEGKKLERALTFTLQSEKFIKEHESILPKDMVDIFAAADKEKYDSPVEKSNEIKSSLISSFFKVQANLDMLTASQKSAVEDFEKLTIKAKREKAEEVYTNIFEPALVTLKAVKKAEEVTKANSGIGNTTDSEKTYINNIIKSSQNHYFRSKSA